MFQCLSFSWCCPSTVVRRAADLTFVQMFLSIPPPSIAVGPVAAPLFPLVLALDGVEKSGRPDLRPDVLQHSSTHRRRPDVAEPFLPAVLTVDAAEKSGRPDPRTFFTTCNSRRPICVTRSEHVLTCEKYVFLPASPASELGGGSPAPEVGGPSRRPPSAFGQ